MNKKIVLLAALLLSLSIIFAEGSYAVTTVTAEEQAEAVENQIQLADEQAANAENQLTAAEDLQAQLVAQDTDFIEATVNATSLNLREGASLQHRVIAQLSQGKKVMIMGKIGNWVVVHDPVNGNVGAVDGKYLTYAPSVRRDDQSGISNTKTTTPKTTAPPSGTGTGTGTGTTSQSTITKEQQQVLDLVNKARADAGVGKLEFDTNLVKVAQIKAKDMVDNNYFSHQSAAYGSPFDMMRKFGISFKAAGENIAGNSTVDGAFRAWMNSPGHRQNILNGNFTHTGIGIVESKTYGKVFVQMFIKK